MVYVHRSPGESCNSAPWTVKVAWSRRSLGVVWLLCSDTLCQTVSTWIGLPWVRPFGVFLVAKEVGSRG
jgi:hypothetical protein